MSVYPQAAPFSRFQSGFHVTQAPRLHGTHPPVRMDSPSPSDTVVQVVCDDASRISSLKEFFSSRSITVHVFRTASEYINNAGIDRVACVILDLDLPDGSGLEVQRTVIDREGPPVLFVTARGDVNSGVRAMKNGAIDFMTEPIDHNRLLAAVEIAFAKDRNNRRERVERLSLLGRWNSLTPREQDVFQHTVAGLLNKQAAAELGITENTFQVHRGRVTRKMKADSLADLVRMATRLELIARSLRGYESTTQSLKIALRGLVEEIPRRSSAMRSARDSRGNRVSTSVFNRFASSRYAPSEA